MGVATLESSPFRPSASLPLHRVEGEKRHVYNDIGQVVTLPHSMGKGRGWGFEGFPPYKFRWISSKTDSMSSVTWEFEKRITL